MRICDVSSVCGPYWFSFHFIRSTDRLVCCSQDLQGNLSKPIHLKFMRIPITALGLYFDNYEEPKTTFNYFSCVPKTFNFDKPSIYPPLLVRCKNHLLLITRSFAVPLLPSPLREVLSLLKLNLMWSKHFMLPPGHFQPYAQRLQDVLH